MNCEEFRQAVTADPAAEAAGHAGACPDCRKFLDRLHALDREMRVAMEIEVPQYKLPAVAGTAEIVTIPRRASWVRTGWIGLAASVALVAVFVLNRGEERLPGTSLADQVIAHLDHEPASLVITNRPVSEGRFQAVARPALVDVNREIGLVTYAASCIINGREVPHLVVQGENGPVTILLLPHEKVAQAIPLQGAAIEGLILPVGNGSVAIIGNRGESIDRWRERVAESIHWTA